MSRPSKRRSNRGAPERRPERGPRAPWLRLHAAVEPPPHAVTAAAAIVVALATLVLAWIAFRLHPVGDYFTESDFYGGYAEGARLIQHGRLIPGRFAVAGPGYELALALVGFVTRDLFVAARLLSVVSAGVTLWLWATLLRRLGWPVAGVWSAAFLAANPVFMRYGYSATNDMLAIVLQGACVFAVLGGRGRLAPLAAGALAALALFTRYNAVYLVPGSLACYVGFTRPAGLTRTRAAALFLAGLAVLALPWTVFSIRGGQVPAGSLFSNFSFYANPTSTRNVQDAPVAARADTQSVAEIVRRNPAGMARQLAGNLGSHLGADVRQLLGPPVAALCGLGLILVLAGGAWRPLVPLGLFAALLFGTLLPIFYSDRYSLALLPSYLALAGLALASPLFALRLRRPAVPLKWVLALVPLALSLRSSVAYQRHTLSQNPVEVVAAGDALRRVAPPGAGVMSRKGHIAYYSGLAPVAFPRVDRLSQLADVARRNGAQYLYFSWYEGELRPEFWYLLDSTAVVPGLTRIPFVAPNPALLFAIGPEFGRDPEWLASDSLKRLHESRAQVQALSERECWGAHDALGEEALSRGDFVGALAHFLAVTRGNPAFTRGWLRAGDALLALGRNDDARAAYERARRLEPANVRARLGIGWTQLRSGRSSLAAQTWAPLVGVARDPATLRAMADVFGREGDAASLAAARQALAALPNGGR
jgi:tetratricopeptide (TPR) repeat protein